MNARHGRTLGIWTIGAIVAVMLLPLIVGGCGGAGGAPGLTGDGGEVPRDLVTQLPGTGDATGAVKDMATQAPVQGATVTIAGRSAVTGADGRYLITGITPLGVYSVTCLAPAGWTVPGPLRPVRIDEGTNDVDDIFLTAQVSQPPAPPDI